MSRTQWLEQGDCWAIVGELTRDTVPSLWAELERWKPAQETIVISLEKTKRVDSSGMAMLIHLIQHAKNQNCHIMLSFVPEQLRTLFQLSNIEDMLIENIKE
jgi:phospholipid transport system transporter-binding protein